MNSVFTGLDLAKNVFAPHGVTAADAVQLRQLEVARAKLGIKMVAIEQPA